MAAVDRADYMDNIKVAEIEQTIQKEKACASVSMHCGAHHALHQMISDTTVTDMLLTTINISPCHCHVKCL